MPLKKHRAWQGSKLPSAARDNMALESAVVLPRFWVPALKDPRQHTAWRAALQALARQLADNRGGCAGGVGLRAVV